jgi:F0F1-type ATP synthase assembly protein I
MASPDPSLRKKSSQYSNYLRYSGLAVQLLAAIGLFGWLGYKLDSYLNIRFPAFMLLFGFLAFGGMMIQLYRTIKRDNP